MKIIILTPPKAVDRVEMTCRKNDYNHFHTPRATENVTIIYSEK